MFFQNRLIFKTIPEHAKTPSGNENWVQPDKTKERSQYYDSLSKKTQKQAQAARERLKIMTATEVEGKEMEITDVKKNPEMTLFSYLKKEVFHGNEALTLQALDNLQRQGYQVDFFPEGYSVKVSQNLLSIEQTRGDQIIPYQSPDTKKTVYQLEVLPFGVVTPAPIPAPTPQLPDTPAPRVPPVPKPETPAPRTAPTQPRTPEPQAPPPPPRAPETPPPPPPTPKPQPRLPETKPEPRTVERPSTKWPPVETKEQEQARNALSLALRDGLALLVQKDRDLEAQGHKVDQVLQNIRTTLDALKARFPYDPDIIAFEHAYADLKADRQRGQETELDASLESIMRNMLELIQKSGVRQIELKDLSVRENPKLKGVVDRLDGLHIHPSYVVESPKPNAKTVVLFMQRHARPLMPEVAGRMESPDQGQSFVESQIQIRNAVKIAVQDGLTSDVYEEGLAYGSHGKDYLKFLPKGVDLPTFVATLIKNPRLVHEMAHRFIEENKSSSDPHVQREVEAVRLDHSLIVEQFITGTLFAQSELGNRVNVRGYDFDPMKEKTLRGEQSVIHRATANNVFSASGLADLVESSNSDVSFVTMGALHESFDTGPRHPLPFSHALAYYGMNVVVVDVAYDNRVAVS